MSEQCWIILSKVYDGMAKADTVRPQVMRVYRWVLRRGRKQKIALIYVIQNRTSTKDRK